MPVVVGLSSITGVSTATSGTDAAYKEYVDNRLGGGLPSIVGNENEFLFTNGSTLSWEPIQAAQEYATAGSYTFNIPTQAKKFTIEATGAGGGGARASTIASEYVQATLWVLRTAGTVQQINAVAYKDLLYSLGGVASSVFWTLRTAAFAATSIQAITFANNVYITAGASGRLNTSTDAISWTLRTSGHTGILGGINVLAPYSTNYIAGGVGGTTMWTQRTTGGTGQILYTSLFDGTNYYVAGASGTLRVSTDTINWTLRTSGTTLQISGGGFNTGGYGLAYASGETEPYLYSGNSGLVATSTDAIRWTLRTSGFGANNIGSIAYGSGETQKYVICGNALSIASSTNAIQWTMRTAGFAAAQYSSMLYVNGSYSILTSNTQPPIFINSTDGITWIQSATFPNAQTSYSAGFTYGNGLYVVSPSSQPAQLHVSTDTIVWTLRTAGTIQNIFALAYDSSLGLYVASGSSGFNSISTDTISWQLRTSGFGTSAIQTLVFGASSGDVSNWQLRTSGVVSTDAVNALTFGNNTYVAGGGTNTTSFLSTSTDTISWTLRTAALSNFSQVFCLLYANGVYFAGAAGGALNTSTNAITWTSRTPNVGTNRIFALTYGNNTYVAGADQGRLSTSPDAITWTLRTSGVGTNRIYALTFGNNTYIVGGDSGILSTSTDAITWTLRTAGTASTIIRALTFANNTYVVGGVGIDAVLNTSTDAITWTLRTAGFSTSGIIALTFANNNYIAAGASGILNTSTDAITWTLRTSNTTNQLNALTFGNNTYVAGGASGTLTLVPAIMGIFVNGGAAGTLTTSTSTILSSNGLGAYFATSTNAVEWTLRTTNRGTETINSLAVGASNLLIAGFTDYNSTIRDLIASTDGVTWELRTSGFGNTTINALTYANNLYLAGGNISSQERWTQRISGFGASSVANLMYDGTNYFASGGAGTLTTSTNTIVWTYRTSGTTAGLVGDAGPVSSGNALLYASGQTFPYVYFGRLLNTPVLASSTDSIVWTQRTMGTGSGDAIQSIAFGSLPTATYIFTHGAGQIYTSTDSIQWTLRTSGTTSGMYGLAYSSSISEYYVTAGTTGIITSSTNAIQWTLRTSGTTAFFRNLLYGAVYVAIGDSGVINTSTNAIQWTLRTSGTTAALYNLAYTTGSYVVSGDSGVSLYSTDAITWLARTSGFGTSRIASVIFGNGIFVNGGVNGTLTTSTVSDLNYIGQGLSVSTNAIQWFGRVPTGFGTSAVRAITYGTIYAIAGDSGRLATSTDGDNWTLRTSGFGTSSINSLIYNSGVYVAAGSSANIRTSTDAIVWMNRSSVITNNINCIGFGNDVYLVGNNTGSIATSTQNILSNPGNGAYFATSTDTISWLIRTTNAAIQTINSLGNSNDFYVAGCTDAFNAAGSISASTDGINWSLRTSGFGTTTINALVYGSVYVAGGNIGTPVIQWTQRTGAGTNILRSITYASDKTEKYVVHGDSGFIISSTNAIQWTLRTLGVIGGDSRLQSVYANGIYLVAFLNAGVRASTDAISWAARTSPIGSSVTAGLTFGNGIYLTCHHTPQSGVYADSGIAASTDTIIWTLRTGGVNGGGTTGRLYFANGNYFACDANSFASSTDTIVWIIRTAGFNNPQGFVYDGTSYLSATGSTIIGSTDTIVWTNRSGPGGIGGSGNGILYDNGFYIFGSTSASVYGVYVSVDGTSWSLRTASLTNYTNDIAVVGSGNYLYVAYSGQIATATRSSLGDLVTDGVLTTSTDTITWTFRTTTDTVNSVNGLAYTATPSSNYIAVRNAGAIQTSTDAIIWSNRTTGTTSNLITTVYGAEYVAAGASGIIISSTNAISWTLRTSGTTTQFNGLSYGNSTYVANGNSGIVFTSTNAIVWVQRTSRTTQNLVGQEFVSGTNTFVVAGAAGALSVSSPVTGVGGAGGGGGASVTWELDKSQITGSSFTVNIGAGGTSNTAGAGTTVSWTGPAGTYTITANGGSPGTGYAAGAGGTVPNTNLNYLRATAGGVGAVPTVYPGSTPTAATAATLSYQTTGGGAGAYSVATATLGSVGGTINYYNNTLAGASSIQLNGATAQNVPGLSYGTGGTGGGGSSESAFLWTLRTSTNTGNAFEGYNSIAYTSEISESYVIVGDTGKIVTSTNTVTWTLRTSISTTTISQVIYGNGIYVMVGINRTLATSTNGIVWTARTGAPLSGSSPNFSSIIYAAGQPAPYILSGGSTTQTHLSVSTNAIFWTLRTSGVSSSVSLVLYAPGQPEPYLFGAGTNIIATSTNTIEWTLRTAPSSSGAYSAAVYASGQTNAYVFGNYSTTPPGYLITSTDAIVWTLRTSSFGTGQVAALNYSNNIYVAGGGAAGAAARINVSTDGVIWQLRTSRAPSNTTVEDIEYDSDNKLYIYCSAPSTGLGDIGVSPAAGTAGSGGTGVKGGGGGGGGYELATNSSGEGGTGAAGYVRISWV